MGTVLGDTIEAGSVLEVKVDDQWLTALVLLANDEAVILDLCDGSTPVVVRSEELGEYRLFEADAAWN
ncbi:MAG: hypothetical protein RL219_795 [Actinomycetota bacterium]|jgi:hypothetical protein